MEKVRYKDDLPKPSEVVDAYWIMAKKIQGLPYPEHTKNGGKWLIFVHLDDLDATWKKVRTALRLGNLGNVAKVSTMKPNPRSQDPSKGVICIYTYDYTDRADMLRVREELRLIGFKDPIPYKTDKATDEGRYGSGSALLWE